MRYFANISFDGTNFYGTQVQPSKRTINKEIEDNISKILNEKIKIVGCSRTDRAVHANNYYFHFETEKKLDLEKFRHSLNSLTTGEIYIKNIKSVKDNFHARFDVKNKEYVYIINTKEYSPTKRNLELQYNKPLNIDLIIQASKHLIGTHNFKSFTSNNEKENYIRTINYIKIKKENGIVKIYINADGFLKYMIRNIIGLFLEINEGKKKIEDIPYILKKLDRTLLGIKVSACGLYLNKVNYKEKIKKL